MGKSYLTSSPSAYLDVRRILEIAKDRPELIYKLPTRGKAINFRQRCYRYRRVLAEQQAAIVEGIPGASVTTPYDSIVVEYIHPQTLRFYHREFEGELFDSDGTPISPDLTAPSNTFDDAITDLNLPDVETFDDKTD